MRALRSAPALVATALLLQACAHVPLGTMWAMRNFSPKDFAAIEPAGLRAAVSVPDAFRLQPEGHLLRLDLKVDGGREVHADVPLVVELTLRESPDLDAIDGAHWHVLKVTPEGVPELQRFQAFVTGIPEGSHGSFELNVSPKMDPDDAMKARFAKGGKVGKLSVALKLDPARGWLTLVDGYPLKVDAPAEAAKP
jgi:hypothetical protein